MLVKTLEQYPETPIARIPLQDGRFALCDPDWFDTLMNYTWYAKKSFSCWYAVRKVFYANSAFLVRMYRVIADTPAELVCHHINRNSLDNRRLNLQNMTQLEHAKLYSWR